MTHPIPVYLVVGDDPYLVNVEVEKILSETDPISIDEFTSSDELEPLLEALATPSMFSDVRWVLLRDAQEFGADAQRKLATYLEDPSPSAVLVIVSTKPVAKLTAAVKKAGRVVETSKGRRNEVFNWLRMEAKSRGLRFSGDALGALVDAVGEERMAIANALDELAISSGKEKNLSEQSIRDQFHSRADVKVYSLVDAVASRQTDQALDLLHRLLRQSESSQMIFWSIARHFRMMLLVADLSASEAASILGVPAWRAEKLVKQARGYSQKDLVGAYIELTMADRKIKKSEEPEELTLERLVVAIADKSVSAGVAG